MSGERRESVIAVRGLHARYGTRPVLEAVDLEVRRGEIFALVGGSGAGKSTLLRLLIMLEQPAAGSIRLFGEEVVGVGPGRADILRRRLGVMFQHGALFSSQSVLDNVATPLHEHTRLPPRVIREIAALKLALVGLDGEAAAQLPEALSGGMLKRAAVARALALDPELLLLDEPSAGLDPVSANAMDQLILQLRDSLGLTVVLVTHDVDTLCQVTDRVAFIDARRVIGCGSVSELRSDDHPVLQAYFGGPRGRAAMAVT
ncbi:MAG TPA: ATP-binding cassette domain-containing protein [Gammaproteobacteria bacterium]